MFKRKFNDMYYLHKSIVRCGTKQGEKKVKEKEKEKSIQNIRIEFKEPLDSDFRSISYGTAW